MNRSELPRAGVMGWPVKHSRSPRLHGYWLKKYGIAGSYTHVPTPPEDFAAALKRLVDEGWRGANVTIPHKEAALALADEATERARAIGAANTLLIGDDGRIRADNTDAFGFIENLKELAGACWDREKPALVLGAGGAARAVIHALLEEGAPEVRLANRTAARAEALAEAFGARVRVIDWPMAETVLPGAGLIVNTTSLGMAGQPPLTLDLLGADDAAVATDIVYTPLITPFLAAAAARGLKTVDGLGMLLHQGRPGFAAWFGVDPKVDEGLRAAMLAP